MNAGLWGRRANITLLTGDHGSWGRVRCSWEEGEVRLCLSMGWEGYDASRLAKWLRVLCRCSGKPSLGRLAF